MKLTTLILLTMMSFTLHAAGKFAFINSKQLMEKSPQAIAANTAMQEQFGERQQNLQNLAKSIQEMEQTYQTDRAIMSDEQKQKAEDNIVQSKRRFQFEQQSLKEDVQAKQRELLQQLQSEIKGVIQTYGKEKGYDFIFTETGVAFASDAVDITDDILEELKK